jgi:DNA-binding IclR family transcriptional regulator
MKLKEPRGIQSIDVSGRILVALMEMPTPVMLKDIANETGIAAAQVHAYLSSFKRMDLVIQNSADGRYSLGALALRMGLAFRDSYLPMRAASETLSILEASTGHMCALVIWSKDAPTVFEVRAGRDPLNVNVRPGTTFSVTGSTVGAVFASFLPAEIIDPIIARERSAETAHTGQWRMTREVFASRVNDARACGFVALVEQPIIGVNSVAVPVLEPNGQLIGSILMLGNESKMDIACGADLYDEVRQIMQGIATGERT